jgi:hypothetical protein
LFCYCFLLNLLTSPFHNFATGTGFDFETTDRTSQFFIDNGRYFFHESITLGNKQYKNVLEINYSLYANRREDDLVIVYYSKEKGIIKFEYKNGKSYQLVE